MGVDSACTSISNNFVATVTDLADGVFLEYKQ